MMEISRRRHHHLLFVVVIISWTVADGYPDGAPDDITVCSTLLPQHSGGVLQTTVLPYDVSVDEVILQSNASYDATMNLTVTISGRNGFTFRGFVIQARQYTANGYNTIGSFVTSPDAHETCQSNGGSTVTQSDNTDKTSIQFTWISPPNATGQVGFRGTILYNMTMYWDIVPAASSTTTTIIGQTGSGTSPGAIPPTALPPSSIDTAQCGLSKGCYFSGCADPNSAQCEYGVTWSADGNGTTFELFGSIAFTTNTPYIALGLSHDEKMGDDSVTSCLYNSNTGTVDVQMSWNTGKENAPLSDKSLSLVSGSLSGYFVNRKLFCRFTRLTYPPTTGTRSKRQTTDQIFYPGSELYHILVAKGVAQSGSITYHSQVAPVASTSTVNFTQFNNSTSETRGLSTLIKVHGILMIFAWMAFASFGMIMPRYYKTAWPAKKWGGKAIWFQLHQPMMIITLILTVVAFIVIFVEAGDYVKLGPPTSAHPALGIAVMALVLINPIMAIFRPDPKHKHRWLFNVFHFGVGLMAHLTATVTLFLAMYIKEVGLPEWCMWVMVGYICWHACIEIALSIYVHLGQKLCKKKSATQGVEMQSYATDPNYSYSQKPKPSVTESYSLFRTVLAVLHVIGVVGCAIAISVQIGIS